ncbi:hypothetical protein GQ53DRAFT_243903 [Thozetella sp. PMI_491]|nr:hypothetical protein GQ53DRAFT_243903 [Thozetella sp. PMI_491]
MEILDGYLCFALFDGQFHAQGRRFCARPPKVPLASRDTVLRRHTLQRGDSRRGRRIDEHPLEVGFLIPSTPQKNFLLARPFTTGYRIGDATRVCLDAMASIHSADASSLDRSAMLRTAYFCLLPRCISFLQKWSQESGQSLCRSEPCQGEDTHAGVLPP